MEQKKIINELEIILKNIQSIIETVKAGDEEKGKKLEQEISNLVNFTIKNLLPDSLLLIYSGLKGDASVVKKKNTSFIEQESSTEQVIAKLDKDLSGRINTAIPKEDLYIKDEASQMRSNESASLYKNILTKKLEQAAKGGK